MAPVLNLYMQPFFQQGCGLAPNVEQRYTFCFGPMDRSLDRIAPDQ